MKIFIPHSLFLRIDDKYVPEWLVYDRPLRSGPEHLYTILFRLARKSGLCAPTQNFLAYVCKCTVRTIQNQTKKLIKFEYIQVDRGADGRCRYTLLLSPRLEGLIARAGIDINARIRTSLPSAPLSDVPVIVEHADDAVVVPLAAVETVSPNVSPNVPADAPADAPACLPQASADAPKPQPCEAKVLRSKGDLFSRPLLIEDLRDLRDQKSPLSPLAANQSVSSPAQSPMRGEPCSAPAAARPQAPTARHTAPAATPTAAPTNDFDRLWAAWPVKKDKLFASRIFASLARARKLPPIQALLAVVERFTRTDRHWLNGFAPKLTWWLKGHCWLDEPVLVPAVAPVVSSCSRYETNDIPQAMPGWMEHPEQLQARIREIKERFGLGG